MCRFISLALLSLSPFSPSYHTPLQPFPVRPREDRRLTMILPRPLFLVCVLTLVRSSLSAFLGDAVVNHFISTYIVPTHTISIAPKSLEGSSPAVSSGPQTTSRSVAVISSANISRLKPSSPAAPAQSTTAVVHRGAGDPCGPRGRQTDVESTLNTCGKINTTYTHAPSTYGVQCLNANPSWNQSINVTSCASNLNNLCESILEDNTNVSQWTWSSGVCDICDFPFFLPFLLPTHHRPPAGMHESRGLIWRNVDIGSQLHNGPLVQPYPRRATCTETAPMQTEHISADGLDLFPVSRWTFQCRGCKFADAAHYEHKRLAARPGVSKLYHRAGDV